MSVLKSKTTTTGWTIQPCFIITLHKKDIPGGGASLRSLNY
jgi:hypothetical protein